MNFSSKSSIFWISAKSITQAKKVLKNKKNSLQTQKQHKIKNYSSKN